MQPSVFINSMVKAKLIWCVICMQKKRIKIKRRKRLQSDPSFDIFMIFSGHSMITFSSHSSKQWSFCLWYCFKGYDDCDALFSFFVMRTFNELHMHNIIRSLCNPNQAWHGFIASANASGAHWQRRTLSPGMNSLFKKKKNVDKHRKMWGRRRKHMYIVNFSWDRSAFGRNEIKWKDGNYLIFWSKLGFFLAKIRTSARI